MKGEPNIRCSASPLFTRNTMEFSNKSKSLSPTLQLFHFKGKVLYQKAELSLFLPTPSSLHKPPERRFSCWLQPAILLPKTWIQPGEASPPSQMATSCLMVLDNTVLLCSGGRSWSPCRAMPWLENLLWAGLAYGWGHPCCTNPSSVEQ